LSSDAQASDAGRALGPGVVDNQTSVRLTEEQRLDWLQLIRSDNVGPRGIRAHLHQDNGNR
jgi:hypothetical protein